ncbi:MAG: hypothetical protein R2911_39160 [Caldilineaceae bacterium]
MPLHPDEGIGDVGGQLTVEAADGMNEAVAFAIAAAVAGSRG